MKVFIHGCQTCGVNSIYLRAIRKYAQENNIELDVRNSKYNEKDRIEHATQLGVAGLSTDSYQPILVDNGDTVKLREWSSLYQS